MIDYNKKEDSASAEEIAVTLSTQNAPPNPTQILGEAKNYLKKNTHILSIILLFVFSIFISFFDVGSGGVNIIEFPTTAWGWIILAILTFAMPTVGTAMQSTFRKWGIRLGNEEKDVEQARKIYLDSLTHFSPAKEKPPRSQAQFETASTLKDILTKYPLAIALSAATTSIIVSASLSGVLSTVIQLLFFLIVGLTAKHNAFWYCKNELIQWYILEANKNNAGKVKVETVEEVVAEVVDVAAEVISEVKANVEAQTPHDLVKSVE